MLYGIWYLIIQFKNIPLDCILYQKNAALFKISLNIFKDLQSGPLTSLVPTKVPKHKSLP